MQRDGAEGTMKNWMDCEKNSMSLVEDKNAVKLYECDGSYQEKKGLAFRERY